MYKARQEKFSYSKLNTYINCPFKYWLTYVKGNFINTANINTYFGTLVHWIEQHIAMQIMAGENVDYEKFKNDFLNLNIPKTSKFDTNGDVYGVNILKERFKDDFYATDDEGNSFFKRSADYLSHGIYRLEEYMQQNPNLKLIDVEKHFEVEFEGVLLTGSIDRVLFDTDTNEYIIEDIKTKNKLFRDQDTVTPLQAVIYSYALKSILGLDDYPTQFAYDLPFCDTRQSAGTKGYIDRGIKKIKKVLDDIHSEDFYSNPTPLCHWCSFCETNPEQPEEGKKLCPYFSLWTRDDKTREVKHKWCGMDKHEEVLHKVYGGDEAAREDFAGIDFTDF